MSDQKAVVEAVGAGRRAASSIHKAVSGELVDGPSRMLTPAFQVLNVSQVENLAPCQVRALPDKAPAEEIEASLKEVEETYTEEEVITESKRCLNCGLICYERTSFH